ncbi:glycosyltransferase family 2 protein [Blastococcus sp. TF02A-26]|uniref:glycosyltransferase family 2 protein n=1 Tax=Blastococcus sp. TF02A-26 TaxID=2250577 RepID=UPI000DE96180|nr:glycosyltransferase family 2 protein [Blastococcus sp. TF02A-26]RBY87384.1 glycosyltransferase family 2 protein [Blastococcus sp. TF02A-26]
MTTVAPADGAAAPVRVSVIAPVRNEAHNIPRVLAMISAQTLPPDEVVFADGMSEDGTRDLLVAADDLPVRVVDNPDRIVPAGLNRALEACTGDVVARMDAHAQYAPDYLEQVVGFLADHPEVAAVGGSMATAGRGPWGRAIAATLSRPFGLGGARHRVGGDAGPIQHVFSGCYRRRALVAAGGWDERFAANEDFEADLRIAAAGGAVWLHPEATSTWFVRESLPALARQMWRYGYYKALTLRLHPDSLRPRQLVPPAVVAGLVVATAARPRLGAALALAYAVAGGALGARAAAADGAAPWRGALVPPVVHLSWGAGLLAGVGRFARTSDRTAVPSLRESAGA